MAEPVSQPLSDFEKFKRDVGAAFKASVELRTQLDEALAKIESHERHQNYLLEARQACESSGRSDRTKYDHLRAAITYVTGKPTDAVVLR